MAKKKQKDKALIIARRILQPVWSQASSRGRTWGPKSEDNPYSGSNITLIVEEEAIVISQGDNGGLRIHEFKRAKDTELGQRVRLHISRGIIYGKPAVCDHPLHPENHGKECLCVGCSIQKVACASCANCEGPIIKCDPPIEEEIEE